MVNAVLVVFLILFIMSTIALSVTTAIYYNRNKTCQDTPAPICPVCAKCPTQDTSTTS